MRATFINKKTGVRVTVQSKNKNESFIFGLGGIKLAKTNFVRTCFDIKKMGFTVVYED